MGIHEGGMRERERERVREREREREEGREVGWGYESVCSGFVTSSAGNDFITSRESISLSKKVFAVTR